MVTTASAITASNWLAMPNIGQMVSTEPVQIKAPQPAVTTAVDSTAPGSQSVRSNAGYTLPNDSCTRNRAIRVPVSIVVRMNRASNMIAKWYQYLITLSRFTAPPATRSAAWLKDLRHAHRQRHRAAGAAAQALAADLLFDDRQVVDVGPHLDQRLRIVGDLRQVDVDGPVISLRQRRGGDQGHDADQPFHQHRAVADHADVRLAADHLGRRARGDQRVKPGDGAAHDADEAKGKDRSVEIRPAARGEMLVDRRRLRARVRDHTAPTSRTIVPIFRKLDR